MRRKWIAAAAAALIAAGLVCGCANPQKAGVAALEEGNYKEAETQFKELAESGDDNAAEGYRGLGMVYYETGDFQAALGISQLRRADAGLDRRQQIARTYNEAFAPISGIRTPYVAENIYHAYHLYIIQVADRLGLYNYLHENKIYAQVHYVPLHLMPYYRQLGNKKGDLPVVEAYYEHCLSLPMYPTLTDEEQQYVIEKVIEFVTRR